MRKLKNILPILLAAVILTASFFGIGYAQKLLPDHIGELEEVDVSSGFSAFTFDTSEKETQWPWSRYQSETLKNEKDHILSYSFTNELVGALLYSFNAEIGLVSQDFSEFLEQSYNEKEGNMYYLKDINFIGEYGSEYVLDLAFTDDTVVYYSCIKSSKTDGNRESVSFDAESLQKEYQNIRDDYEAFKENELGDKLFDSGEGESETDSGNISHLEDYNYNRFAAFIYAAVNADYTTEFYATKVPHEAFRSLIENGVNTGVTYSDDVIDIEFTVSDASLTLFYSPEEQAFTGFSLKPNDI